MVNYKHLRYFWVVAKEGSIARAAERLRLTPQTISGQLGLLEDSLGTSLLSRVGRGLELTDTGRLVLSYAEEIFSLGEELEDAVRNAPEPRPLLFRVGVANVVPKSIAYRLLAPALQLAVPVRMVCREEALDTLLGELALHRLDLVIADRPLSSNVSVRAFNHPLGECGVSFFVQGGQMRRYAGAFPQVLEGAPLLLPGEGTAVRTRLLHWLSAQRIQPRIVGEFDDSSLMKTFGRAGTGIFMAPTVIASEVVRQYGVSVIGETGDVRERFYAISVERRISHPAVAAITERARSELFLGPQQAGSEKQRPQP